MSQPAVTFERALADLLEEIDRLKSDNAYLRTENASLWESVHTLQDMVTRAHTEDA